MPVRKAKQKNGMSVGADERYHDEGQDSKGKQPATNAQAPEDPSRILDKAVAVAKSDWGRHIASTPRDLTEANRIFRAIMDDMEDAHRKALQALSHLSQQQGCDGGGVLMVRLDKSSTDDLVTRFDDKLKILHRLHQDFVASRLETHHRGMRSHMSAIGNRVISGREIANAPVLPDEYAVRTDAAGAGESCTTTAQTVAAAVSTVAPTTKTPAVEPRHFVTPASKAGTSKASTNTAVTITAKPAAAKPPTATGSKQPVTAASTTGSPAHCAPISRPRQDGGGKATDPNQTTTTTGSAGVEKPQPQPQPQPLKMTYTIRGSRPSLPAHAPPPFFTTRVSATELNSLGSMRPNKGRKSGGGASAAAGPDATAATPSSSSRRETRSYTPSPPRRDEKKRRVEGGN